MSGRNPLCPRTWGSKPSLNTREQTRGDNQGLGLEWTPDLCCTLSGVTGWPCGHYVSRCVLPGNGGSGGRWLEPGQPCPQDPVLFCVLGPPVIRDEGSVTLQTEVLSRHCNALL